MAPKALLFQSGVASRDGIVFTKESLIDMADKADNLEYKDGKVYITLDDDEVKVLKSGSKILIGSTNEDDKMGCCGNCGCKEGECNSGGCKAGSGNECCSKDGSCNEGVCNTEFTETQLMMSNQNALTTEAYLAKTERMMSLFGFLGQMLAGDNHNGTLAKMAEEELARVLKQ